MPRPHRRCAIDDDDAAAVSGREEQGLGGRADVHGHSAGDGAGETDDGVVEV
ncbi:hypothetical protein DFH09DRAFT_1314709 [Mycena vulgaris]|nr:hypothetical protein DFH09DRAFT_1314709 [Mycena vulgaris]